ncbi:MAG: HAD family hydrolase [Smithellaceae bacterium]|nr:HAD family hydrolase [Smithellaceae bacterium]
MNKNTAIFLDRDGTINDEVGYLDHEKKLQIIPAAFEAIRLINESGMKAVVITNQAGVARGFFTEAFVRKINGQVQSALLEQGALIDRFYFCPHHPTEGNDPYRRICNCRKPEPGMLQQAAADLDIDLARSYLIGDRFQDIEAAHRAGARGVLVMTGYGQDLMQEVGPDRANELNQPDYVARDILEAVHWILKDRT